MEACIVDEMHFNLLLPYLGHDSTAGVWMLYANLGFITKVKAVCCLKLFSINSRRQRKCKSQSKLVRKQIKVRQQCIQARHFCVQTNKISVVFFSNLVFLLCFFLVNICLYIELKIFSFLFN